MLRTAAPLRASSLQAFVGSPLVRRHSARTAVGRRPTSSSCVQTRASLTPLSLPSDYGYVILTAAASAFLVQWQAIEVSRQRRRSGIEYPKMYEDAEVSLFNCYQRAHQNTLETYPAVLGLLAMGGLGYPITSSVLGMIWIIGRVVYTVGYFTGEPKNRLKGMFHFFAFVGLFITCVVLGVRQTGLLSLVTSLVSKLTG